MEKPRVKMHRWYFAKRAWDFAGFSIPKPTAEVDSDHPTVLFGETEGHPRFDLDRAPYVMTSTVLSVDLVNRVVETRNTIYELTGEPLQRWVDWLNENGFQFEGVN